MRTSGRGAWGALLGALACACAVGVHADMRVLEVDRTASAGCPGPGVLASEGYSIRTVTIETPFQRLPWIRERVERAKSQVASLVGKPFAFEEVKAGARIAEDVNFSAAATREETLAFMVRLVVLENCANRQVDVVYRIYSTRIAPTLGGTLEAKAMEASRPEAALGASKPPGTVKLIPRGGYDPAFRGYVGAEIRKSAGGPVEDLYAVGVVSDTMHDIRAGAGGSLAISRLASSEWSVAVRDERRPLPAGDLRIRHLAAQWSGNSEPLGSWHLPLRFGGTLEYGWQGDTPSSVGPAAGTSSADYRLLKLYVGATRRWNRTSFAASVGLEGGATDNAGGLGWMKYVADVAHELSIPAGDHRTLDIESRLTGGYIDLRREMPVSARFFGGGRAQPFVVGEAWDFRANPVARGLGANRFALQGLGGTRFAALNLNATVTAWRMPLVPPELSKDKEFREVLEGSIQSAESSLRAGYAMEDMEGAALPLEAALKALKGLEDAVAAARAARAGVAPDLFDACTLVTRTAVRRTESALKNKDDRYSEVLSLLGASNADGSPGHLARVIAGCLTTLNGRIHDPAIAKSGEPLRLAQDELARHLAAVDRVAAERATADLSVTRTILRRFIGELNIAALSPMLLYDVARLGAEGVRAQTRQSVGAGLRFTLVGSVDVTMSYARNLRRQAGEPTGAFLLEMRIRDLF